MNNAWKQLSRLEKKVCKLEVKKVRNRAIEQIDCRLPTDENEGVGIEQDVITQTLEAAPEGDNILYSEEELIVTHNLRRFA